MFITTGERFTVVYPISLFKSDGNTRKILVEIGKVDSPRVSVIRVVMSESVGGTSRCQRRHFAILSVKKTSILKSQKINSDSAHVIKQLQNIKYYSLQAQGFALSFCHDAISAGLLVSKMSSSSFPLSLLVSSSLLS